MGFFDKQTKELEARGLDPARLPPGQYFTDRFPVLHAGVVPEVDLATWDFTIDGLGVGAVTLSFAEILDLPSTRVTADIHCVTKWSKFDTEWDGVAVTEVLSLIEVPAAATHVLVNAEHGFTANLPIEDFSREGNLFAYNYGGEPLEPDHGWPLRLVVPHLYFWKSVKWTRGFTFLDHDEPGFWERNGYHMYGDPFQEQRFWTY
ncbi:MAG: sulfite oxidase-like oxidoreductase [Acidimicrobiia bacterium]